MKPILIVVIASIVAFSPPTFAADACASKGKLRHVVSFKFKESATPEQIKEVEKAFCALKAKIPQIASLEWGTNCSPEKHSKGFTHCFVLTFNSDADRDAYLPHPAHKAFGKSLGPVIADVFVVDFRAKE
ncbi:MAG: Dabb family protein [Verrucomicrobia bacterium]|nr:Dabb family protein [Verrucomicrobiota bacterium]MCX6908487.1 Dabb family protein [Verrucomicrobiota bacterium]